MLVSSQPFYAISGKTIVQKGAVSHQVTQLCNSKTWIEMVKVSKDGVLSLFIGGPPEIENKGHPPVDQGLDSPQLGCPTSLAHTLPQLQRPHEVTIPCERAGCCRGFSLRCHPLYLRQGPWIPPLPLLHSLLGSPACTARGSLAAIPASPSLRPFFSSGPPSTGAQEVCTATVASVTWLLGG